MYIYFFSQTYSRQKKNLILIHFEIQYKSFWVFFYLKEQINLQHQSYGNCFKSADTRPIIQSLHTTVESISCTSKLNACAPKYIIKIEQ